MEYITTAVLTILFTLGFLAIYKYGFNPQMIMTIDPSKMAKCPDGWNYDGKVCNPAGKTTCMPFDPDAPTLDTAAAKCNLARSCSTTWSGMCG